MPAAIPKGHVYLARKILASSLWGRMPSIRVAAVTSIVNANHQDLVTCPDWLNDIQLRRGQFVRCWKKFSDDCGLMIQPTRTAVASLEKMHFLQRESCPKYSIYTVNNYKAYQSRENYGKDIQDGYVLIARKIVDSELWERSPEVRVVAITSLLMASFQPGMYSDGTREIEVKRGTFISTMEKIRKACRLDLEVVERAIKVLEGLEFIRRTTIQGVCLFSIFKYDFYQDPTNYQDYPKPIETEKISKEPVALEAVAAQIDTSEQQETNKKVTRSSRPRETEKISYDPCETDLPESEEDATETDVSNRMVTRSQQDPNKTVTRPQQEPNKTLTRDKKVFKNGEERGEGKEGGRSAAPPPPTPLLNLDLWGAPPPLPPEDQIANAYRKKFEGIMGHEKARKQGIYFLKRGGKLHEALKAIEAHSTPDPIWKILDPLLTGGSSTPKSGASSWVPPEERTSP